MTVKSNIRLRYAAIGSVAVVAGLVLAWWAWWAWAATRPVPAVYDIPRTVRYSVTVTNPTNEFQEAAKFWVFAPVARTAFQRVSSIEASHPYEIDADELGNQRLLFSVDIPPYGSKTVSVDAHLEMAKAANSIQSDDAGRFLRAEEKIESNAEPIAKLGQSLTRKSDSATSDAIYNWVSSNVQYTGYARDDRGALFALTERHGDCTEYSYLYTALARSAELPSRPIAGFVTAENAIVRARDIHNWAEVSLDGKWRVVDPQYKRNRVEEHHHIAMRVLGEAASGLSSTHQMIGTDSGLDIRLN